MPPRLKSKRSAPKTVVAIPKIPPINIEELPVGGIFFVWGGETRIIEVGVGLGNKMTVGVRLRAAEDEI